MSFGRAVRNKPLTDRCKALAPVWARLRRSRCPAPLKLPVLASKFWASALHGAASCPLAASHIQSLRTQATRALGWATAGASPMLRLCLSSRLEADPGFYELWTTLRDLRRLCRKQPSLLDQWRSFMQDYDGTLLPGPFSKLLQLLGTLGWTVLQPPILRDQHGLVLDLVAGPLKLLRQTVEEAWGHVVARAHRHRPTMADMQGLNWAGQRRLVQHLTPLQRARLSAIQAGSAYLPVQQSRFDNKRDPNCPRCRVPETVEHRLLYCPRFEAARADARLIPSQWEALPVSFTHHLLLPANPHLPELRQALWEQVDTTRSFGAVSTEGQLVDLFTDGSCQANPDTGESLAAWSLVDASRNQVLASGPVAGAQQTVSRAELQAVLAALEWRLSAACCIRIWSDSQYVVKGLLCLRDRTEVPACWDNFDLWEAVLAACLADPSLTWDVIHVPSHLDPDMCENPFEDWVCTWNQRADRAAVLAVAQHSDRVQRAASAARHWELQQASLAHELCVMHLQVAEVTAGEARITAEEGAEEDDFEDQDTALVVRAESLSDRLSVGWQQQCAAVGAVPVTFALALFGQILQWDDSEDAATAISWLELAAALAISSKFVWPRRRPEDGAWTVHS